MKKQFEVNVKSGKTEVTVFVGSGLWGQNPIALNIPGFKMTSPHVWEKDNNIIVPKFSFNNIGNPSKVKEAIAFEKERVSSLFALEIEKALNS